MFATELINNKWYFFEDKNSQILYFKFRKATQGTIFYYDRVIYNLLTKTDSYISNAWFFHNNSDGFFETDIKEFAQYLPIKHIDRKYYFRRQKIESLLYDKW